ncbi:MAG: YifB family Mg chelatase-like AAA ATPase [Planctomycetota bacterium]
MVVRLTSGDVHGIEGRVVEIEVDLLPGLSNFIISGLPGKRIRESRERIRSAITNSGFHYPQSRRIVVNLAPAEWEKDGAVFDLPIALGILMAAGQVHPVSGGAWGVVGELSLDGRVRPSGGTLGIVAALRRRGVERVLLPAENLPEGRAVAGIPTEGIEHLRHAAAVVEGRASGVDLEALEEEERPPPPPDLSDVIGQERAKRALALAAAGGHNLLLVGPPGAGKSLLARRLPGLLLPPSDEEVLEITQIHSASGLKRTPGLLASRPFRAPHHTVSWAGLVGGGGIPRPGEITLAHRGVLFLDELPEFPRRSLEALREPMEEGRISICRARCSLTFPAAFLLVAAMNPCPCGYALHPRRSCHCSAERIRRYLEGVSGPLLDRIDIRLEVQSVEGSTLLSARPGKAEGSAALRGLVERAIRYRAFTGRRGPNSRLTWSDRRGWAPLSAAAEGLLAASAGDLDLSTRGLTRVLRVARTIADAESSGSLEERHLLEALEYRSPRSGEGFFSLLGDR